MELHHAHIAADRSSLARPGRHAYTLQASITVKFLFPCGGITDNRFGILTSPFHRGVPIGITHGLVWAADVGVINGPSWVKRFDPEITFPWLESMQPWRETCLFVQIPDVVGDAQRTIKAFWQWRPFFANWPVALVAQDGFQSDDTEWDSFDTLFIGGSTEWKVSEQSISAILFAQKNKKHIHIGRVNNWRRYELFRQLPGSERFTCDGTKQRFVGVERTIELWSDYMERDYQLRFPISLCDSGS